MGEVVEGNFDTTLSRGPKSGEPPRRRQGKPQGAHTGYHRPAIVAFSETRSALNPRDQVSLNQSRNGFRVDARTDLRFYPRKRQRAFRFKIAQQRDVSSASEELSGLAQLFPPLAKFSPTPHSGFVQGNVLRVNQNDLPKQAQLSRRRIFDGFSSVAGRGIEQKLKQLIEPRAANLSQGGRAQCAGHSCGSDDANTKRYLLVQEPG